MEEGFCTANGVSLFYRIIGKGDPTIIFLHGGPGGTHDAFLPYMAELDCRKVFFDQRGSGRSGRAKRLEDYTIANMVEDTEELRKALGLGHCVIFGHSYGGMLALEYGIKYSNRISKLMVESTPAGKDELVESIARVYRTLKPEDKELVRKYRIEGFPMENGHYTRDYLRMVDRYYIPYIHHVNPPKALFSAAADSYPWRLYRQMLGGGEIEFEHGGNLRDWDSWGRLHKIGCPVLVMAGKYDYCVPESHPRIAEMVHQGKFVGFSGSAHRIFADENKKFLRVVSKFAGAKVS